MAAGARMRPYRVGTECPPYESTVEGARSLINQSTAAIRNSSLW